MLVMPIKIDNAHRLTFFETNGRLLENRLWQTWTPFKCRRQQGFAAKQLICKIIAFELSCDCCSWRFHLANANDLFLQGDKSANLRKGGLKQRLASHIRAEQPAGGVTDSHGQGT